VKERAMSWRIVRGGLLVAGLAAACGHEAVETPVPGTPVSGTPVAVETVAAVRERIPIFVTVVGTVQPWLRAEPGTKLMGRVTEIPYSEGDAVKAGAILVSIENLDLVARQAQTEGAVEEAKAVLANAETHFQRMLNLLAEAATTQQQVDNARTDRDRAAAALDRASATLQEVQASLGYAAVRAPFDGVVTAKYIEVGDMATAGRPLLALEQQSRLKVLATVNEQDVAFVEEGDTLEVDLEGRHVLRGAVLQLNPANDPVSRTVTIEVALANPDGRIRSGMFARVRFVRGARDGITVPSTAVVERGQLDGVFVVRDGQARLRWIRLGKRFVDRTEVLSGVRPGEQVIVSPPKTMMDGNAVEVRRES